MGHLLQAAWQQALVLLTAGGLEGSGIPWPGTVVIAGAGATTGNSWPLLVLVSVLFSLAYCLGALAQYAVGRMFGATVLGWLSVAQRTKLETLMTKYGTLAVLWARPLAVGNYVSIPAGMVRMPILRFVSYTLLGVFPWALGMTLIGHLLGSFVLIPEAVKPWLLPALIAFGAVGVVLAMPGVRHGLRRRGLTGEP